MRLAVLLLVACGSSPRPEPVANQAPPPSNSGCAASERLVREGRRAEMAREPAAAAKLYDQACQQRAGGGCYGLGLAYNLGLGVRPDPARATALFDEAVPLLQHACDGGCAPDCAILGWTFHTGQGHRADDTKSIEFLERACTAKSGEGCFFLSQAFSFGYGVDVDLLQSLVMARASCDLDDAFGCNWVANHYEFAKDTDTARAFHARACKLGLKESCEKLGAR